VIGRRRDERASLLEALAAGGSLEPGAEADALLEAANDGAGPIDRLVARRLEGEPLPWITGWVRPLHRERRDRRGPWR
jgi:hypothetical protein